MHGTISFPSDALRRHAVTIDGAGEHAIIFCNGYGCDQGVWHAIKEPLSGLCATVTFDHTGGGGSDIGHFNPGNRHATLDGYALDLIEVCDALPFRSLSFVGHSVGTTIGLLAAARRPELFKELILVAPSASYINGGAYRGGFELEQIEGLLAAMDDNFTSWASMIAPVIIGGNDGRYSSDLANSFCRWNEEAAKHFARLTFLSDHRDVLRKVENDCLILQCRNDAIAPAAVGRAMAGTLPHGHLMELNNAGHCPHLTAPAETMNGIIEYLRYRGSL